MKKVHIYKIGQTTMAILPVSHVEFRSKILDVCGEFYSKKTPIQLVKEACSNDGCSYEGKRDSIISSFGFTQKTPIPVRPGELLYAFPTTSPEQFECMWIFVHQVHSIAANPTDKNSTMIFFHNHVHMNINASVYTTRRQPELTHEKV